MNQDLLIRLIIEAVDKASGNIDGISSKVGALKKELLSNEFTRTAEGLDALGPKIDGLTEPAAHAAGQVLALNAALTAVGALLAGQAYDASVKYESALTGLAKVLDGGQTEAEQYGRQLDELALKYGQNGLALVASMADFVQAGYSAKESVDLVEQSIRLMIAGDIDAASASQDLVSILKGFGAPASEAGRAVDILNEVSNKYATDVRQLAEGMSTLAPIAHQMGFSFEETAGLLTPIIEVFQSGSEAGEAMKTSLLRLTDDSKPIVAALDRLGVSQRDVNGELRSGRDIFLDVAKAMQGLSDADRLYLTQQLTGIDQAARATVIFGDLAKYLDVTQTATTAAGSAMAEVERQLQGAEMAGKQASESFRQLGVTIGNQFRPEVAAVISASGDLGAALRSAFDSGQLAPLIGALTPQITAVQTLIKSVADNLDDALAGVNWQPLVAGLGQVSGALGDALRVLMSGFDLTTVDGLRAAIQAVVNTLGNFATATAGVVDGMGPFFSALNSVFGLVTEARPGFAGLIGEITGTGAAINLTVPTIMAIGEAIFGVVGKVINLVAEIGLLIVALNALNAAGLPVGAMFRGLLSILGEAALMFGRLPVAIAGLVSALVGFPGVVAAVVTAAGGLGYALGRALDNFTAWATGGTALSEILGKAAFEFVQFSKGIIGTAEASTAGVAAVQRLAAAQEAEKAATEQATAARVAHNAELLSEAEYQAALKAAIEKVSVNRREESALLDAVAASTAKQTQTLTTAIATNADMSQTVEDLTGRLHVLNTIDLGGLLNSIGNVAGANMETARALHDGLIKTIGDLNAQDLSVLMGHLRQLGKEGAVSAQALGDAFGAVARAAADRLGVDVERAMTGISKGVRDNLNDLAVLRESLGSIGITGRNAGDAVVSALTDIAKQVQTKEELAAVREAAKSIGTNGAATAAQLAPVMKAIGDAAKRAGDDVETTSETIHRAALRITAREQEAAAAAHAQAAAEMQAADAAEQHTSAMDSQGVAYTRLIDPLEATIMRIREMSSSVADNIQRVSDSGGSMQTWEYNILQANTALQQVTEKRAGLESLIAEIKNGGGATVDLATATRMARTAFGDLNAADLSRLNDAVERLREQLAGLEQDAARTLKRLQDQADQAAGRQVDIENRQYQADRAEIEGKIKAAQNAGSRKAVEDLSEALRLLDQNHITKLRSLQKRETGGPVRAGEPYIVGEKRPEVFVPEQDGRIVPSVEQFSRHGRTLRLELALPGGSVIHAETDPSNETRLLRSIERERRASA